MATTPTTTYRAAPRRHTGRARPPRPTLAGPSADDLSLAGSAAPGLAGAGAEVILSASEDLATSVGPGDPRRVGVVRRIAWNFLSMGAAEVACRGTSVLVTLSLAKELGRSGFGRVEFAFNVVFWLVLLVRNGCEVIAARELARHPRLVRSLVNHLLAVKLALAIPLYAGLVIVGSLTLTDPSDRALLNLYGLMLLTTALGIDFVYRGLERMGLLAVSLYLRTAVYAVGVSAWVVDARGIAAVPAWLALGEALGIGLVWWCYARDHGLPRPSISGRFLRVLLHRCRPVLTIQLAQTVLGSVDLMAVGLLCTWDDVGLYGAPHRMVAAALTFGMIFQQVVFPALSRSWRDSSAASRGSLDALTRVLMLGAIPLAVGTTILARPLVAAILPDSYAEGGWLLAVGIWRAPLLTLAFLYHTALIALNRESSGVRLLAAGAIGSGPLVAGLLGGFGLVGASAGVVLVALLLAVGGYVCLVREGRQPKWHHHVARPLIASALMAPACLVLGRYHLVAAVAGGASVYLISVVLVGGLRWRDVLALVGRGGA